MAVVDRYRLAPVRDARTRDERLERGALAAAVGGARATADDVAVAAARVAAARTALDEARRAYQLAGSGPSLAIGLAVFTDRFTARRRRDLDAALGAQLRAEAAHAGRLEQLDSARGRLARARADREVIERHFARWREQQKRLADRRDD